LKEKHMDLASRFDELLLKARKKLSEGASSESPEKLATLIQVIKDCEAASQQLGRYEEVYMRLTGALNGEERRGSELGQTRETASVLGRQPDTPSRSQRMADADKVREEFLSARRSEGINLYGLRGKRLYQTETGKRAAICYASEDKRGDLWWMGLPDEHVDTLVAICRASSGEVFDFVLPHYFLAQARFRKERRSGQLEFHVKRSGPNFELTEAPGKHINEYLHTYHLLR
jgi:hypothetical protein